MTVTDTCKQERSDHSEHKWTWKKYTLTYTQTAAVNHCLPGTAYAPLNIKLISQESVTNKKENDISKWRSHKTNNSFIYWSSCPLSKQQETSRVSCSNTLLMRQRQNVGWVNKRRQWIHHVVVIKIKNTIKQVIKQETPKMDTVLSAR